MKIYDCFTFYNEFDLLELRLQELYDHVDHFVLVEADRTFQNKEKPFYFTAQLDDPKWVKYRDKIIVIQVADMPDGDDAWARETHQRNAIMHVTKNADPNDIIMVSDLDEIIRPETVDAMRADDNNSIWGLRMPLFYFKFNHMLTTTGSVYTTWGMACRQRILSNAEELRKNRFQLNGFGLNYNQNGIRMMEHAGWQFSYFGDTEFAKSKIQSFSHTETNRPEVLNSIDVERSVANGDGLGPNPVERFVGVHIDDYFPKSVRDNPERWSKWIVKNTEHSVWEYLPKSA